jgi:hypothetical protein
MELQGLWPDNFHLKAFRLLVADLLEIPVACLKILATKFLSFIKLISW